jgi:hypothetical protein
MQRLFLCPDAALIAQLVREMYDTKLWTVVGVSAVGATRVSPASAATIPQPADAIWYEAEPVGLELPERAPTRAVWLSVLVLRLPPR